MPGGCGLFWVVCFWEWHVEYWRNGDKGISPHIETHELEVVWEF